MTLTPEALREKYGDTLVLGVDHAVINGILIEGFTCPKDAIKTEGNVCYPLHNLIHTALKPRLRREAELDASFKQIIPYVILEHAPTGRIYTTMRTGGDSRLIGQVSIGLGDHMDVGEDFQACLMRELHEEIGMKPDDIKGLRFCGYLYSEQSEVDSVHVGMVYRALTTREDLQCLEADKLTGAWLTQDELRRLRGEDAMESWSRFAFDTMLAKENAGDGLSL